MGTEPARLALAFLTRIPVRPAGRVDGAALSRAALFFPVVGILVGAVIGGVHALAGTVLDPAPATLLALLTGVGLTGALHEDGLADAADALGAHVGPQRRREILKDPRLGSFGVLALVFAALWAFAVLVPLDDEEFLRVAVVAHVVGRWTILPHAWWFGRGGEGSGALIVVGAGAAGVSTVWVAVLAVLVTGVGDGLLVVGLAALATALGGAVMTRAFGGVRGDAFGAVVTVAVLAGYAVS